MLNEVVDKERTRNSSERGNYETRKTKRSFTNNALILRPGLGKQASSTTTYSTSKVGEVWIFCHRRRRLDGKLVEATGVLAGPLLAV